MKKVLISIIICFTLLASCSPYIRQKDIEWATSVCKNNDGLKRIVSPFFIIQLYPNAICNNGAVFKSDENTYKQNK